MIGFGLLAVQAVCATVGAVAASSDPEALIVTARKRPEQLLDVPESVTTVSAATMARSDIRDVVGVASRAPNLAFAYGNAATGVADARTLSIRGISGPNTTAVYLDQTPLPDSIDPQLVDLARVEILRGPQGTVYGESSLGGAVKLISAAPDPARRSGTISTEAGATRGGGRPDLGLEAVLNLPVSSGKATLRASGFVRQQAGYLNRSFPEPAHADVRETVDDQGAQSSHGVSLALLTHPSSRLDLTARATYQRTSFYGYPATLAPLPDFRPISANPQPFNVQPRITDAWLLPALEASFRGDGWRVESSFSGFRRRIAELEDSTIGTAQFLTSIGAPLAAQPYAWRGARRRDQISHETRLLFGDDKSVVSGLVGVFASKGWDDFVISPLEGKGLADSGAWTSNLLWQSDIKASQQDLAAFGQVDVRLGSRLTMTLGARQYWLKQTYKLDADGFLNGGRTVGDTGRNKADGVSPKFSLAYHPGEHLTLFASAGKGFRAGGSGQAVIPQCDASLEVLGLSRDAARQYAPDTLWSYEAGAKAGSPSGALRASATVFHIDWRNIQQSVFLPSCAFIITTNAGAAAVDGGELELAAEPVTGLTLRFAGGYHDARITRVGATAQSVGSRVYQTPRWTLSASAYYDRPLADGGVRAFIGSDASYTGDSISGNGGGRDLKRPAYVLVNARLGVAWPTTELALSLRNIGNARPNLGDIGYLGYGQRDPSSPDLPLPMVATLPPTSAVIQVRRVF